MRMMVLPAVCVALIFLANLFPKPSKKVVSTRMHLWLCVGIFLGGCALRLFALGTLPAGMSAQEALIGMQAKALATTGKALEEAVSAWSNEASGSLLVAMIAPWVGLFGANTWTVRLPLALLSCAALPAAYGIGKSLSGKTAGRYCMLLYAVYPYFVLSARVSAAEHVAAFLLPIALCALLYGVKRVPFLYVGAALLGLLVRAMPYWGYILPAGLLVMLLLSLRAGVSIGHAVGAYGVFVALLLPEAQTWLAHYGQTETLHVPSAAAEVGDFLAQTSNKVQKALQGGFLQLPRGEAVSLTLLAPTQLGASYYLLLPLMVLGAASLLMRFLNTGSIQGKTRVARMMVIALGIVTFVVSVVLERHTVANDATMFLFAMLLAVAGLCRMERVSWWGALGINVLVAVQIALFSLFLFGGSYEAQVTTYFQGLDTAAEEICAYQKARPGTKVNMTTRVYPHEEPQEAAQLLLQYALGMPPVAKGEARKDIQVQPIYVEEAQGTLPDSNQIYVLRSNEADSMEIEAFEGIDCIDFVCLLPKAND